MEPVFFHQQGDDLMEEVLHMLGGEKKIARVIDLTAGDGVVASICLKKRIYYTGMCFTEVHICKLRAHLTKVILNEFRTEGSALYKSGFAVFLDTIGQEGDGDAATKDPVDGGHEVPGYLKDS